MGNEVVCRVEYDGEAREAKTLLETDDIVIRSPFRLQIPFREMSGLETDGGSLRFLWNSRAVAIDLGADAEKWAEKIRNPKSRIDKIGIRSGQRVSIVGTVDADFRSELEDRGAAVSNRLQKDCDVVFLAAAVREDLERLSRMKDAVAPDGAVWVIRPKGTKTISDADVIAAGKRAGLVDVKVVRFSPTHTAEKLVIPVTKRR
jgi:hypothetical protein